MHTHTDTDTDDTDTHTHTHTIMYIIPPVVGADDSTVVGISEWSPASGARVGGCLQSECVSEEQGMC